MAKKFLLFFFSGVAFEDASFSSASTFLRLPTIIFARFYAENASDAFQAAMLQLLRKIVKPDERRK